ncbi:MAG: hypothetical protein GY856_38245, partial [bacterium]|nr:hypothetical protein [bacterium]
MTTGRLWVSLIQSKLSSLGRDRQQDLASFRPSRADLEGGADVDFFDPGHA